MHRLRKILRYHKGISLIESSTAKQNYTICITILGICTLIGLVFYFWGLSEANIMSVYVLGILLISAAATTWVWGIVSAVVGVLLFNCLFAIPRFTLFFYDLQYSITTVMMLVASLAVSYVTTELRRQLDREMLQTQRSAILLETSQQLQQADSTDEMLGVAMQQIHRLTSCTTSLFLMGQEGLGYPLIQHQEGGHSYEGSELKDDRRMLEQLICRREPVPAYYPIDHPRRRAGYFSIQANHTVYGVVGVLTGADDAVSGFARNLIRAMLDETALAIERFTLHEENELIQRQAEGERMRTNLLRSVSHDLRTPLTSISGNADILLSSAEKIGPGFREQLYQDIRDDAEWLIDLVENLLFVSRMEDGAMMLSLQPELLQELIPEAVRYVEKRASAHRLSIVPAEELIMVWADSRMLIQVIVNLVDNAVKYTPPGSEITVRFFRRGKEAVVEVADTGNGLDDVEKSKVFDMFYTINNRSGDGRRGIGIGLALCQSIVQAHGGRIYVRDNEPKGAVFGFTMQIEEVHFEGEHTGD